MVMKPYCVVCGFSSAAAGSIGSARFADYIPPGPRSPDEMGLPEIWRNSLGVPAPEGVGLFCRAHFERAQRLGRFPSAQAVEAIRAGADRQGRFLGWLRGLRP